MTEICLKLLKVTQLKAWHIKISSKTCHHLESTIFLGLVFYPFHLLQSPATRKLSLLAGHHPGRALHEDCHGVHVKGKFTRILALKGEAVRHQKRSNQIRIVSYSSFGTKHKFSTTLRPRPDHFVHSINKLY